MKTKKIFALVSALTIAIAGAPTSVVFAEELDASANETVVEATADDATTNDAVDPVVIPELVTETEEKTDADSTPTVESEVAEEATNDEAAVEESVDDETTIVLVEEEEIEEKAEEEVHEHNIIYAPVENHQHKIMCAEGGDDCDFEEKIADCIDENGDGYCDLCGETVEDKKSQKSSGITITVRSWTPFLDEDNNEIVDSEGNVIAVYQDMTMTHYEEENRINISEMIDQFNTSDSYHNIDPSLFKSLDGISAVYDELLAIGEELPSDTFVSITEKNGVIENFSVNFEDNYDPELNKNNTKDTKLVDTDAEDTEDPESKEELSDDVVIAKEDEILPEETEDNNSEDSVTDTENTELESIDEASEEVATADNQVADSQTDTNVQTETTDGE